MRLEDIRELIVRDLENVKKEVLLFENEEQLWERREGITNCAGNLVLHICGNLRHYIGAELGQSGYVRQRANEFDDKNTSSDLLISLVDDTINEVSDTFERMEESDLALPYPSPLGDRPASTCQTLLHLHGHLNYHLGQINYYRRIRTNYQ